LPNSNAFVVCLLDDDISVLKGLTRLFSSAGLHAETFSNPEKFLRYARIHRPAVALIDVCMPHMSGLEVQSQLRKISPSTASSSLRLRAIPWFVQLSWTPGPRLSRPSLFTTKNS
jgi:FixJ family two-component response regulator